MTAGEIALPTLPDRSQGGSKGGPETGGGGGRGEPDGPQTVSLYEKWRKIYPLWVNGGFQTWRRVVLVILLFVFYASPWLQWNGNPGVHFDLAHRRFTILWSTFVPEEFIFLAWALLIAALVLFTVTVAAGRIFCGWACPQTVWSLVYFTIEYFIEGDRNTRMRMDRGRWNRRRILKKSLKYTAWALVALSISTTFLGYFVPIRELLPRITSFELSGWEQFFLFFPAAGSFLMSGVLREQVCFHMCPYARFQSVMFDHDSLIISYDVERGDPRGKRRRSARLEETELGSCVDCRKCVSVCPTGIDIRDGLQYQCIGCAACVDACTDVMQQMGYGDSLVRYSTERRDRHESAHWLRPRLVAYASMILVMIGLFAFTLTQRSPLSLDVKRDRSRLYREFWDGSVENVYTLRISNRGAERQTYRIGFTSELPLEYHGEANVEIDAGKLESVPIRLTLSEPRPARTSGESSAARTSAGAAEGRAGGESAQGSSEVRFSIETVDPPGHAVEKTSLFHRPTPASAH
jgi:cytochrome c oxidase accessory protein FixG